MLTDPVAGEEFTLYLNLSNPFDEEIVVKLRDENKVGGAAVVTECSLASLRPGEGLAPYKALTPFEAGTFTLTPIALKYVNPDTRQEETVQSQPLNVTVIGTTSMSGASTQFEKACEWEEPAPQAGAGQQGQQPSQPEPRPQDPQAQIQQIQSRIQNNQQAADTQAIKEALQQEVRERSAREDALKAVADANPEMQAAREALEQQGYQRQRVQAQPTGEGSGTVREEYAKPSGETASLTGTFANQSLQSLLQSSAEIARQLEAALNRSPEVQAFSEQLARDGFAPTDLQYTLQNQTAQVRQPFANAANDSAAINATVENLTRVTQVSLDAPAKRRPWWPLVVGAAAALAGLAVMMRRRRQAAPSVPADVPAVPFDHLAEARRLISRAEQAFPVDPTEAYALASQAIRLYISHTQGPKEEITADAANHLMRGRPHAGAVRDALVACRGVEFAKKRPERAEFERVLAAAKKLVRP